MDGTRKPAAPASVVDESQSVNNSDEIFGDAETFEVTTPWTIAQPLRTVTDSFNFIDSDVGKLVVVNSLSACTASLNTGLDLIAGQRIDILQVGEGIVTFNGTATLNQPFGRAKYCRARYAAATILCVGADSYVLIGDLGSV